MTKNNLSNKKRALILSGINWNDTLQRHQSVAAILAELGYEVYFVEGIISSSFSFKKLRGRIFGKKAGKAQITNEIPENINVISNGYVNADGGLFYAYNRSRNKKLLSRIGGFFNVVINYLPVNTTLNLISQIEYGTLIYDCVRDFANWGGYPKNLLKNEETLIGLSDYVFTDSFYLTDKMRKKKGDNVIQFLPIIGEELLNHYNSRPIEKIKKIGYVGTLGSHVDIALLKELSEKGYEIHVFGVVAAVLDFPVTDHGFFTDLEDMMRQVTICADALIIPYKGNMDGVIPAKTMQCLATGLPVYISNFYDSRYLRDYFQVYTTHKELFYMLESFDFSEFIAKKDFIMRFVKDNTAFSFKEKIKALLNED